MKKVVIIGSGTAGLITAAMMNSYWGDKVDITIIYDASRKNIAVGESTTPIFRLLLRHLKVTTPELIKELGGKITVKLGVNFKNWIPGTQFFHGFQEVPQNPSMNSSAVYSILEDKFNGGLLYNEPTTTIPDKPFDDYGYALHIDTVEFCNYIERKLSSKINLVDDLVVGVRANPECNKIVNIECRDSGLVDADLFVDASGFSSVLFKHLNPRWNDIEDILPINRAIPQQVSYNFKEVPSYTQAEATENGWIWRIPIGERYGTGYLYSSRFTSDDEAKEKYNTWLLDNFNTELTSDRVIKYRPGYYDEFWIGNCIAVGLSSGFVEPLEATGIEIIINQIQEFMTINSTLKNLEYNRDIINRGNKRKYDEVIDFVSLHYCTNRTDSEFWRYMTANKKEWVRNFEEKCREEFLDTRTTGREKTFWGLDSFVQVANGLNMISKDSIRNFIYYKVDGEDILNITMGDYQYLDREKKRLKRISHKRVLDLITK